MRIQEIGRETGLTQKSIRFYEAKGLIEVARAENSYREYSRETVDQLCLIRLLRGVGVRIADLQLWHDGVVPLWELLEKRKRNLEQEKRANVSQLALCGRLLADWDGDGFGRPVEAYLKELGGLKTDGEADERAADIPEGHTFAVGVDIGTTTISAVVLDLEGGTQAEAYTVRNDGALPAAHEWESLQDANAIVEKTERLLSSILKRVPRVRSIGVTGQMHGIVYVDARGRAVSPLATWQDGRAGIELPGGGTCCDRIRRATGRPIAAGYGLATHYYNRENGLIPADAESFCTVMDYAVMRLTGREAPLVHVSNAASFGLFDVSAQSFDEAAVAALGPIGVALPETARRLCIAGTHGGIPVAAAVGDNQASFLGSVRDPGHSVLANYGTGSQITRAFRGSVCPAELEIRPLTGEETLLCGSALCGGRAYAALEAFFRQYAAACGLPDRPQYEVMNELARQSAGRVTPLAVSTRFCGTRQSPDQRGTITGIGLDNLTPPQLILGVLQGMADELYGLYRRMPVDRAAVLVASGNAVRRNPALQTLLSQTFGMPLKIPLHREEAAFGAALAGAVAAGAVADMAQARRLIVYEGEEKHGTSWGSGLDADV